jgi:drug/metabolite transporter (DMT)-like permease
LSVSSTMPKIEATIFSRERLWLGFAIVTTIFWGIWGALIEVPEKAGFPATLGYCVWAITMVPCALVALWRSEWKLDWDWHSTLLGCWPGFLGAGGQLLLFQALRTGPAYLVFPIISLYPMVTVFLSVALLKERASRRAWTGIAFSMPAIVMLSWQAPADSALAGHFWLLLASLVFLLWGTQAYLMKLANRTMSSESIFFYMALTGVGLIPVALLMTDFSKPINWGFRGPYLAGGIQLLNSLGALCLVFALRYGKAIIVVPMTALAPVLTVILSLALYRTVPHGIVVSGVLLALLAIYLMAE